MGRIWNNRPYDDILHEIITEESLDIERDKFEEFIELVIKSALKGEAISFGGLITMMQEIDYFSVITNKRHFTLAKFINKILDFLKTIIPNIKTPQMLEYKVKELYDSIKEDR
jgi:hypothetical protein